MGSKHIETSVIIPTLNEEKYIAGILKDLSNQTYKNFETIVVDSSSNDHTSNIAESFNAKVIKSSKGTSLQRNLGANHAQGDNLIFLDADIRLFDNNFLEKINSRLKGIAGRTSVRIIPHEETFLDKFLLLRSNNLINIANKLGFTFARGGCQVVKKDFFNKVNGYQEHIVIGEDNDLFQRLKKHGKIDNLKLVIYESPRRYRKEGYHTYAFRALFNGIYKLFTNKSLKKYKPIR